MYIVRVFLYQSLDAERNWSHDITFTSRTTSVCPLYSQTQEQLGEEEEGEADEEESIDHRRISLSAPPVGINNY